MPFVICVLELNLLGYFDNSWLERLCKKERILGRERWPWPNLVSMKYLISYEAIAMCGKSGNVHLGLP